MESEKDALVKIMSPILPTSDKLLPYLNSIDNNGIYSNFGPLELSLRERLARHFGIPTSLIVTCTNATLGILGALETSQMPEDTTWELPAWTFTATSAAMAYSRYNAKFVDVDAMGRVVPSKEATAIIDVLPFGDEWEHSRLSEKVGAVVVDAAASFDAIREIPLDRKEPFAMILSLHATKILPAGEGGLFISNDPSWVIRFQNWTRFGMQVGRVSTSIGLNAKLSEYAAAICHASLDEWIQIRESWVALGKKAANISDQFGIRGTEAAQKGFVSPYWIINLSSERQKSNFVIHLNKLGIETRDWWESGCHKMPAYKDFKRDDLIMTDGLANKTLGLPFHLCLTDTEWKRIKLGFETFFEKDQPT